MGFSNFSSRFYTLDLDLVNFLRLQHIVALLRFKDEVVSERKDGLELGQ